MKIPFPVRVIPLLTFRAWLTPPPVGAKTLARDRETLDESHRRMIGGIDCHEVGEGPLVLALHGWGGRPAQMLPVARRLARDGYRVVLPELPGHGGGDATDIKATAAAVEAVIGELGHPDVVVAHSFASLVLRLVFPDEAPAAVVLVAPALNVNDALDVFGDRLRLMPWSRRGLHKRLEAWDRQLWPVVSSTAPDAVVGSEILIVHDPDDEETPFSRAAEFAALRPRTTLVPTAGVGHRRILSDSATHDRIAHFVRSQVISAA